MLLSPATRSTMGVGKVEHGSVADASVFAGSAEHAAVATIRRGPGDVGRSDGPVAEKGPNAVRAGHGATVCGALVPSSFQFPLFHAGGFSGAVGQSIHQTCTVTPVAGDGPRELTSTTVTALPTTRIASAVACHHGGFGGFGSTAGGG